MAQEDLFEELHQAVGSGDYDFVTHHIGTLEDKDKPHGYYTLLMQAALQNDPKMVELLIDAGASVEVDTPSGWSALSIGIMKGGPDAALTLIELGADVNREFSGQSLFEHALYFGEVDVARRLVEVGARPADTWDKPSVLIRAVEQGDAKLLECMGEAEAFESVRPRTSGHRRSPRIRGPLRRRVANARHKGPHRRPSSFGPGRRAHRSRQALRG